MRRFTLPFLLSAANLFAFSDLQFTPDTAYQGDTVTISGNYGSVGDTAAFIIAYDLDGDGKFTEENDAVAFTSEEEDVFIIDGGEMDSAADGTVSITFEVGNDGPFGMPGNQIWIMEDGGSADTATITIAVEPTNTSISGSVTTNRGCQPRTPRSKVSSVSALSTTMGSPSNRASTVMPVTALTRAASGPSGPTIPGPYTHSTVAPASTRRRTISNSLSDRAYALAMTSTFTEPGSAARSLCR